MTGGDYAQIILATATLVTAIGGVMVALRASRKVGIVESKVDRVERATNGMKDQLVAVTATASKAEGKEEERLEEKVRQEESGSRQEPQTRLELITQVVTDTNKKVTGLTEPSASQMKE